jgi:hypothetical protein
MYLCFRIMDCIYLCYIMGYINSTLACVVLEEFSVVYSDFIYIYIYIVS